MKFKTVSRNVTLLGVIGLLGASLAFGETTTVRQLKLEKEGIDLIGRMEDVARDIRYNSDRLHALSSHARASQWTHQHHLTQIRELVNSGLRPNLSRLTEIQGELKDWHQEAIDQMLDAAKTLAADTNAAILSNNAKGAMPPSLNPEYQELIARINEHAEKLVKTSDAAGDYASAHEQAEEAGLKLPAH